MSKASAKSSSAVTRELLLVEDDPIIGPLVRDLLKSEGFRVEWVTRVKEAHELLGKNRYHLVILDINLPDGNGLELCKELRADVNQVPVLMLTSISEEDTLVRAFSLGANDYLKKPFGKKELLARVKFQMQGRSGVFSVGPIRIDVDRKQTSIDGKPISLTPSEMQIFMVLAKNAGEDVSRERLLNEIDPEAHIEVRTLDSHVSHLRKKLMAIKECSVRLTSVPKVGYRLDVN